MNLSILESFKEPFKDKEHRYIFLQGGRGSGKSQFAIRKVIYRMLTEKSANFIACRSTNTALRKSLWRAFPRVLREAGINYDISKTEQIIRINDNEIVFVGLDDPERIKSLEGINAGGIIEEALEITRDQFDAVDSIIRGNSEYAQLLLCYNPDRKTSFIYNDFYLNPPEKGIFHITTIKDNYYLSESEYVEVLESIKDEEKRKSWLNGEWASLGDLVLDNYKVADYDIQDIIAKGNVIAGVDWGFKNPSVFLLWVDYDGDMYIIDEIFKRSMQTIDFIELCREMLKQYDIKEFDVDCYPENAETDRNELLEDNTNLCVHPIKKDKTNEIATLKEHDIIIHPQCEETIKEIGSWAWAKDRDGNSLEKPVKRDDHGMDALCYSARGYYVGLNEKPGVIFI